MYLQRKGARQSMAYQYSTHNDSNHGEAKVNEGIGQLCIYDCHVLGKSSRRQSECCPKSNSAHAHLLVVIPVSVVVKNDKGAPITVFSNRSWRSWALLGTIFRATM